MVNASLFLTAALAQLALGAALPAPPQPANAPSPPGPSPPGPGRDRFVLPQAKAKPAPVAPLAMQRTYFKLGKSASMPRDVKAAAAGQQKGSVAAVPQPYDVEYLCNVTVGNTVQSLAFDTGSSDLWVFSKSMPPSQQTNHRIYQNTGTLQSGQTWSITYGDGSSAQGVVYSDKVTIGNVTATSQAVEAATSVSSQFVSGADDGLVGLAFPAINQCQPNVCNTFMGTVGSSLASNLFASYLRKGQPGKFDFGYIDTTKYTGSLVYTPITTANGFWEFNVTGYAVGSAPQTSSTIDVIADTGTTLIYLPQSVVTAYYNKVSGSSYNSNAGGYLVPCNASMPSFSVFYAGAQRTVPGSYLIYGPYSGNQCYGSIQPNTGLGLSILGDAFLKSQYVVYDIAAARIGFAQQTGLPSA